jgi:cell pole-organizing protein PopZ
MSQAAKAQEPSMEEILASIRRIIADDEAAKPAPRPDEPAEAKTAPPPIATSTPVRGPTPAEPATAEPPAMSQEDIDTMLAGFDVAEEAPAPPADEPADVLELTPAMEAREPAPASAFRTIEPTSDVFFTDPAPEPADVDEGMQSFGHAEAAPTLLSDHASAAVTSAFGSLAHTVLVQNARTLDDLVREMLRPMLKSWLDDNLPTIVERLVRAEIERVSRGRG